MEGDGRRQKLLRVREPAHSTGFGSSEGFGKRAAEPAKNVKPLSDQRGGGIGLLERLPEMKLARGIKVEKGFGGHEARRRGAREAGALAA